MGLGLTCPALLRFEPEKTDPANAGLGIVRDLLLQVAKKHPQVSLADLWTLAGALSIEWMGGPAVPFMFGRSDDASGVRCPANGRLPDASQGAAHLRQVFGRMGFSDGEIVALSGAHTVGRCHASRSGFDVCPLAGRTLALGALGSDSKMARTGPTARIRLAHRSHVTWVSVLPLPPPSCTQGPWTEKPLTFDNEYFRNLVQRTWVKRDWDGPLQYEDAETGQLMMLPTDLALRDDPGFSEYVHLYARNQDVFFAHFSTAFGKLLALGCPEQCQPRAASSTRPSRCPHEAMEREEREKAVVAEASAHFREFAMHGSLDRMKSVAPVADVHAADRSSGRTALHKASFWVRGPRWCACGCCRPLAKSGVGHKRLC